MSSYPRNKFEELSEERKVRVLLDTIYKIENQWGSAEHEQLMGLFADYFKWSDFFSSTSPFLSRISSLEFKLDQSMSLRSLLDIAVPLERYLNLAIKDEHLVAIREGDQFDKDREEVPLYFVLDHLRSAFNVGSLFRTAECLGAKHIFLVGYTPTPEDQGVKKTAMGTESFVTWSVHNHLDEVKAELDKDKIPLVALETSAASKNILNWKAPKTVALLVGNERFGLTPKSLQLASEVVEIPMFGMKNSLNVANSLSVVAFEVIRQWKV